MSDSNGPRCMRPCPIAVALALVATIAAESALNPQIAQAQIVPNDPECPVAGGTTVNCTGDLSPGVRVINGGGALTTLNVNTLTDDITPAAGVDGLEFTSTNAITINSTLGDFEIITQGAADDGIRAVSSSDDVTIDHQGDISATGRGIVADAGPSTTQDRSTVTSEGNISAGGDGIFSRAGNRVRVTHTGGDITSTGGDGVDAVSASEDVFVTVTGDITASGRGVFADAGTSSADNVVVETTGGIVAGDDGIRGRAVGDITVTHIGDITSTGADGVDAISTSEDVVISVTGDVAASGRGIVADAGGTPSDRSTVTSEGNIVAGDHGIFSRAGDIAVVTHTGDITSTGADGVNALSSTDDVRVTVTGDITALGRGVFADGGSSASAPVTVTTTGAIVVGDDGIRVRAVGNANVTHIGDITSTGADGVDAVSTTEDATVNVTGNVTAFGRGIVADAGGSSLDRSTVTSAGNIVAGSDGIFSRAGNRVRVTHTGGDITSTGGDGVDAVSSNEDVFVTVTGDITASGRGILADAGSGSGDTATVVNTGDIGSGGRGIDGRGRIVSITQTGDITADTGDAIRATGVNIASSSLTVTVNAGSTVTGGSGASDGVNFSSGRTNLLTNFGRIRTAGDNAVEGSGGDETIENAGIITGDVDLGGGANAFNNNAGGLFNSAAVIDLGAGDLLTNAGTLAPGRIGNTQTSALTGDMVQTGGGTYQVDFNVGGAVSDFVDVSGTADLAGTVLVQVQNPQAGPQQTTILTSSATTDSGLGLSASPLLNAQLLYPNAFDVVLAIDINFLLNGLNTNQTNIAKHLNAALGAGGGGLGGVFSGLLNGVFTVEDYANALDQLSPEIYGNLQTSALYSSLEFTNNLLSCRMNGRDTASIVREGQCLWVGAAGRFLDSDQTREQIGFDETTGQFAAGAQVALDPVWRLGFGIGYQTSNLDTSTNAEADGDQLQGGVALKYNPGPLLVAAAVSGGRGWYDITRPLNFGGFTANPDGDAEIDILAGQLHGSYVFGAPSFYVKPMVDLNLTRIDLGNVTETGGNGAGLLVNGSDETVFSVSPAIEAGTEWWLENGTLVRPYLRVGGTWFEEDTFSVTASFDGSPAGVAPFVVSTGIDDVQLDVGAGLDVISAEDANLRFGYDGHFGDDIDVHSAGLKGSARF